MGRRGYPPEFRRKVVDPVEAGRPIAEVAKALGISAQSIHTWAPPGSHRQGLLPGLSSHEHEELMVARRRVVQLETELAVTRRAAELLKEAAPPSPDSTKPRADQSLLESRGASLRGARPMERPAWSRPAESVTQA